MTSAITTNQKSKRHFFINREQFYHPSESMSTLNFFTFLPLRFCPVEGLETARQASLFSARCARILRGCFTER